MWDQLKRDVRKLEGELEVKLTQFSRLCAGSDSATAAGEGLRSHQTAKELAGEISGLFSRVEALHNAMEADIAGSELRQHTVARHRDIVLDYGQEFKRLSAQLGQARAHRPQGRPGGAHPRCLKSLMRRCCASACRSGHAGSARRRAAGPPVIASSRALPSIPPMRPRLTSARWGCCVQARERAELLAGARESTPLLGVTVQSNATSLIRERNHIQASASALDGVLAQAGALGSSLHEQRGLFDNIGNKLMAVGSRFPVINGLMNAVRRRKSWDTIVVTSLVVICSLVLLLYVFRKWL